QNGNITAVQFQNGDVGMNVVGNVLGTQGVSTVYEAYDSGPRSIFQLGSATDISATSLFRHGNYDVVNAMTIWDPATEEQTLPPSLYLKSAPRWWPNSPWPWAGPDLSPMVGELPAKKRAETLGQ